ncbi:MAG TPA: FHA domain-containing protein [Haliangium sp.]|nr:FHA domain-containing protein [Haliangium sp.]
MGCLIRRATGDRYGLSARHVVGRSPASHLTLESRLVSHAHAELLWNGANWEIHDLGSRNGTFVDGLRLEAGGRAGLRGQTQIAFGDADDPFELVDDGPPSAVALSDDGQRQESEQGILILPHAEQPMCTIFEEGGGEWVAELEDGALKRISSGGTLRVADRIWRIELPGIAEHTWQVDSGQMRLQRATLRFLLNADGARMEIQLLQDAQVVSMSSRSYHQLLYKLAQARLADQARADVPEAEAGWMPVDALLRMLDMSEPTANVYICRARKDLARAGVVRAADLVERQATPRRMRLGVRQIEIVQS